MSSPNYEQMKVAILGAGKGGSRLLEVLSQLPGVEIRGVADKNPNAPGLRRALDLDQADEGQQAPEMRGTDVAAIRHGPARRLLDPIIIELLVLGNDQLRLEGYVSLCSRHAALPALES